MSSLREAAAAAILLLTSPAAAPTTLDAYMAAPHVVPAAQFSYGAAPSQVAELFLPSGEGPFPVAILIHGGCWQRRFEGLAQTSGLAADLAKRGVAVWNIDYRGIDEAGGGYPGTYDDISAAIARLQKEAAGRHLNLDRVVLVGHSAGGHLALWATAARQHLPGASPLGRPVLNLRAVVSLGAISDLAGQEHAIRNTCEVDPARLTGKGANPLADTSPAAMLPLGVKAVVIHGALDEGFPPAAGEAFVAKARKAGDNAELVVLRDAGHFDLVTATTPAWRAIAERVVELTR